MSVRRAEYQAFVYSSTTPENQRERRILYSLYPDHMEGLTFSIISISETLRRPTTREA